MSKPSFSWENLLADKFRPKKISLFDRKPVGTSSTEGQTIHGSTLRIPVEVEEYKWCERSWAAKERGGLFMYMGEVGRHVSFHDRFVTPRRLRFISI